MIKFITVEDLLPVRNAILREGKLTNNDCRFPTDNNEGNIHLGYYIKGELACAVSFHPQNYGTFTGTGYQLRGMATILKYQRQGIGNQLINFAIVYLQGQKAGYIWCNARKVAVKFYQKVGFEAVSPEFELPPYGPHYVMQVKI